MLQAARQAHRGFSDVTWQQFDNYRKVAKADFIASLEPLGGRNFVVIGVVPRHGDIYAPSVLAKIRHIQDAVEALPEAVRHNVISLAAKRVKDIQGNADGMVVRELMERIPQTAAELEAMRQAVARNPVYVNALVSPDGSHWSRVQAIQSPPQPLLVDRQVDTTRLQLGWLTARCEPTAARFVLLRMRIQRERAIAIDRGHIEFLPINQRKLPLQFGVAETVAMGDQDGFRFGLLCEMCEEGLQGGARVGIAVQCAQVFDQSLP